MLGWIVSNWGQALGVLLLLSEGAAAGAQLMFPTNKGVSGILQTVIKFLQTLGAKDPGSS